MFSKIAAAAVLLALVGCTADAPAASEADAKEAQTILRYSKTRSRACPALARDLATLDHKDFPAARAAAERRWRELTCEDGWADWEV